jgi:hypothetical protein
MPKYAVLITCQEYVEVDAKDARDAEWVAYQGYRNGELEIEPHLVFVCEECDLVEEENESND